MHEGLDVRLAMLEGDVPAVSSAVARGLKQLLRKPPTLSLVVFGACAIVEGALWLAEQGDPPARREALRQAGRALRCMVRMARLYPYCEPAHRELRARYDRARKRAPA